MKRLLLICLLIKSTTIYCQTGQLKTFYGYEINPVCTLRALNIFINIIYDQCGIDTCDPCSAPTPLWMPGPINTINESPPDYLDDYMDNEFDPNNIHGVFTKRYAEASFNNFIVIGDFVIVNIAQSLITPSTPNSSFTLEDLMKATITLINDSGGLKTIHEHNSLNDYDGNYSSSETFLQKSGLYNGQLDLVQIWIRNCTSYFGGLDNGGFSPYRLPKKILINGSYHWADLGTIQGKLGNFDLSDPPRQSTDIHELMHLLVGPNSMHMGGGGPLNRGDLITLEANSGGWSLIGSANSSLVSCNGFERWRLDWLGPENDAYPIAASNDSSDVEKGDGNPKTFYLRDFITFGDVIRIKLPYIDSGALNQYIWLENHQIHNNGKEDYPAHWKESCKDDGIPGIYAYYQVGKDKRDGSYLSELIPYYTDHLVPITADGNWDVSLLSGTGIACVNGNSQKYQHYFQENPFGGYNDLSEHFFNSTSVDTLNWWHHREEFFIKLKDGVFNNMASSGDNYDAFIDSSSLSLSSNPASVNVITYHNKRRYKGDKSVNCTFKCKGEIILSSRINNSKIHLSGLRIDMEDQQDSTFKVDIRWDDYDVTNDVRWTGDIVLHEELNLLSGNTITLDQNYTPNKHIRDPVTGVFAGPTYFTCLENSSFTMQSNSNVVLQNLSSFILEPGSDLEIYDSATLTVKSGCTFYMQSDADLVIKGCGKIVIESGGYICIAPDANITLKDPLSFIYLYEGYISGVNPDVLNNPGNCITNILEFLFLDDIYIQDTTFTSDAYIAGENIFAGSDVDPIQDPGPVSIENQSTVILNAGQYVIIEGDFEVESGSEFEIE